MSLFNDIFCDRYDNKDECLKNANYVKTFAGRFGIGQWSFIGPGSEKKWYPSENSPQGEWGPCCGRYATEICRKWTSHLPCNDSIVQCFAQKQRTRKAVNTLHCRPRHSWYNLSHYSFCQSAQCLRSSGSNIAKKFEDHQDRTGEPVILVGHSVVLGEVKAEAHLHDEEPE